MTGETTVTREQIISAIINVLEPLDYVYAMWEGGGVAFGRIDEWSDIDLYVDAEDGQIQDVFPLVERALESLSPIKLKYVVPLPPSSEYAQAFYRLEKASEFLLIDLAVIKRSGPDKFLEIEIHGKSKFHFNKGNLLSYPQLNRERLICDLRVKLEKLEKRFDLFSCFIPKEMNRGNYIEAVDLYYRLILDSLTDALRIKYKPVHHAFKTHHIRHDLPDDVIRKLATLYFVKDEADLRTKFAAAKQWFRETVSRIDLGSLERDRGGV